MYTNASYYLASAFDDARVGAAGGPNGTIAMDLPTQADVATFLCVAGRTIPGPCNDSQVHFFIVNDNGLHFWYPTRDREKPVEHTDDSLERAQPAEYIDVLFWTSYQWGMAFEENSGHPSNTQLREHFTQRR